MFLHQPSRASHRSTCFSLMVATPLGSRRRPKYGTVPLARKHIHGASHGEQFVMLFWAGTRHVSKAYSWGRRVPWAQAHHDRMDASHIGIGAFADVEGHAHVREISHYRCCILQELRQGVRYQQDVITVYISIYIYIFNIYIYIYTHIYIYTI